MFVYQTIIIQTGPMSEKYIFNYYISIWKVIQYLLL